MLLGCFFVLLAIAYFIHQYIYLCRITKLDHLHGGVFICHCRNGRKAVAMLEADSIFTAGVYVLRFKSLAGYREASYVVLRGTKRWKVYASLPRLLALQQGTHV